MPPLCQMISVSPAGRMCHPRPTSMELLAFSRVASIAVNAAASGDGCGPSRRRETVNRSFVVDRSAPAPANVGRSQFDVGVSDAWCPAASRERMSSERVIAVRVMPSGPRMRVRTSASYSSPAGGQRMSEQSGAEIRVLVLRADVARELLRSTGTGTAVRPNSRRTDSRRPWERGSSAAAAAPTYVSPVPQRDRAAVALRQRHRLRAETR